jgi:protein-tyrosine phosphatase
MVLKVLSQYLFDENMIQMGLNDENVENTNMAFISIIGTKECLNYYLDECETKHFFNDKHENVLNLDFDDISTDVDYDGHIFKTMTMEQAEKTIEFVEMVIKKGVDTIVGHCRAGMSRSRAIFEWIYRYCQDKGINVEYEDRNDYTTILNQGVLRRLNHAYWKKHRLNCYANGEDYEEELIHPETIKIHLYE